MNKETCKMCELIRKVMAEHSLSHDEEMEDEDDDMPKRSKTLTK